jgi:mono/diheme cytochrome c family protein
VLVAMSLAAPAICRAGTEPLSGGATLFNENCADCHAAGLIQPGYLALQLMGMQPAALSQQTNLNSTLINYAARNGIGAMPAFTPTQLTDAQLQQIVTYLTRKP